MSPAPPPLAAERRGQPRPWRRWRWLGLALVVAGLVGVNASAWLHARAMTRWADDGARTRRPEELSLLGKAGVLFSGVSIPRPLCRRTPGPGLESKTLRFPNGRGDELEAWHVPAENARAIVALFHGYVGAKSDLLFLGHPLRALGVELLFVDFHGSGGSSGSGTGLGVYEAWDVRATAERARELRPDLPLVLYGISMGGAAVLRAVAHHGVRPDGIAVEATFGSLLSTVGHRFDAMGLPAAPFAHLLVFWGGVDLGIDAFDHVPIRDARAVTCPAIVLQGGADTRVPVEEGRAIFEGLAGWKRYHEFEGAKHGGTQPGDPERWQAAWRELLEAVTAHAGR